MNSNLCLLLFNHFSLFPFPPLLFRLSFPCSLLLLLSLSLFPLLHLSSLCLHPSLPFPPLLLLLSFPLPCFSFSFPLPLSPSSIHPFPPFPFCLPSEYFSFSHSLPFPLLLGSY